MITDRRFWEAHAHVASASLLARFYPEIAYGAWVGRIRTAKAAHPDITLATFPKGTHLAGYEKPDFTFSEPAEVVEEACTADLIERDREVRRLREQLTEAKRKLEASYSDGELEDRICGFIERVIPSLPPVKAPTFPRDGSNTPESVVALFSDYHIGEHVSFEGTGGLNAYDMEVFKRRLQYHVDSIGSICHGKLTGYTFPELVIVGLGDMVSGIIHDELVESADGDLMDWLIEGSHAFALAFRQLAAQFPEVRIEWHFGNHGRTTQKPRFKKRWVNYDYLLGHMIATELKDQPNVTFTNHKSFWSITDVQGIPILNLHGDNIKGWNGIPIYGINRAVGNLTALLSQTKRRFEIVVLGHFHQSAVIERMDCDVVLNGSAIGGNEFSYGALFAGNKPRQIMFGVHPKRAKTWLYQIDLSDGDMTDHRF